jgi:serine/threonine protein kinase
MLVDKAHGQEEVLNGFVEQLLNGGNGILLSNYCENYPFLKEALEQKYKVVRALEEAFTDENLGGTKIGEYLIIEEIGRGGMGVVYLALQQSLRRYVALKVLPFGFVSDSMSIKRFRTEAEIIARFNHPNIVPVYSMGEEKGNCYIAMALIPGLSLNKVLQGLRQVPVNEWSAGLVRDIIYAHPDFTRLNVGSDRTGKIEPIIFTRDPSLWKKPYPSFVLTLCAEIADALSYAHKNGICHGDLKPSNIMLTYGGVPMIVDFGLAKDMQSIKNTQSQDFLGTIAYASPERVTRNIISPTSEIWSLGATMYEILSTNQPFQSGNVAETVTKILRANPPMLRAKIKGFPRDAEAIVFKCLEKSSEKRYARVELVKEDINDCLLSKPIMAKPIGRLGRSLKWFNRNRLLSMLICVLGIVLVTGPFVFLDSSIKKSVVEGTHYVDGGNYPAAIHSFERAMRLLKLLPFLWETKAAVYSGMGDAWFGAGKFKMAIDSYERSLQIDADYVPALSGMGDVYFDMGQYAEAIVWYSKVISLSPENRDNYYERGESYEKLGFYHQALCDFHKAIQLAPGDMDTMQEISRSLSLMGTKSETDRIEVLRKEGFNETEVGTILQLKGR